MEKLQWDVGRDEVVVARGGWLGVLGERKGGDTENMLFGQASSIRSLFQ